MKISSPKDLFALYELNEDIRLKITQFYNANPDIIYEINAILLAIKKGCNTKAYHLHTNIFLAKLNKICVIYQLQESKVVFIDVKMT